MNIHNNSSFAAVKGDDKINNGEFAGWIRLFRNVNIAVEFGKLQVRAHDALIAGWLLLFV